jgi:hypothetical protein
MSKGKHSEGEMIGALKNKYDPDNLFRLNQNIEPSQAAARSA